MPTFENDRGNLVQGIREIVLIQDLHKQGLSVSAIARKVGCDRKTVKKYIERGLEVTVSGALFGQIITAIRNIKPPPRPA